MTHWIKTRDYDRIVDRYADPWEFGDQTSYRLPSVLVGGSPESGKSTLMLARYFLPALEAGTFIQHVNDPARSFGIAGAANALWFGLSNSLLIDDLADPSFGLGIFTFQIR